MSEEDKKEKKPAAARKSTGDTKKLSTKKPAAKKPAAKKPAAKEAPPKPAPGPEEKAAEEAAAGPAPEERPEATRTPEAAAEARKASGDAGAAGGEEEEMSPEEFQKFLEEQMEKITVREIVERLMMDMASLAYQKMGLPEQVNLKYRDLEQARMAIDALRGLLGAIEGKVPESEATPFRSTLANLQMNYVRLANPGG